MSVTRLSPLCLVFIIASSASASFPYAYPVLQSPPSYGPHLIYSSGVTGNADLTGFSYFTKDFGGGQSEVVFFTGPNSDTNMNNEVAAMKNQLSSLPATTAETETAANDKKADEAAKSDSADNEDPSKIAPLVPVETTESSTASNAEETSSTTATPMEEGAKDSDGVPQLIPEKGTGFEAPYPVFRLGGAASYYPQISTSFVGFGGYEPSDYFRSQYDPFYNRFNSYQTLYNPAYPSLHNGDYYNPIFPSIYQSPLFAPASGNVISGESQQALQKLPVMATILDRRIAGEETPTGDNKINSMTTEEKSSEINDQPMTEKEPELPTSTEQMSEQSEVTTTSESTPATADDIKTTTILPDPEAVP